MQRTYRLMIAMFWLLCVSTAYAQSEGSVEQKRQALLGKVFPALSLKDIDRKQHDIHKKLTVINLWFVGCKPCVEEMPLLNVMVDKYKGRASFWALSPDSRSVAKRFLQKRDFKYEVFPTQRKLITGMGIYAYPTHMILDAEGKIRFYFSGGTDRIGEILESEIEKLLKE